MPACRLRQCRAAAPSEPWHPLCVSSNFAPLPLGEVMSRRSFDATGPVNALSKHKQRNELMVVVDKEDRLVMEEGLMSAMP